MPQSCRSLLKRIGSRLQSSFHTRPINGNKACSPSTQEFRETYGMEFSPGLLEVEIYENNYTLLRYTNATGLRNVGHATRALEDVASIFRKANLERNIPFLRKGK